MAEEVRRELLDRAQVRDATPFDYVIVGSGAGGGPLAARLALAGKRVLLVEAGGDAALDGAGKAREVYEVPAYHAAATEDPAMSWEFSVRHFEDDTLQARDTKYRANKDPSKTNGAGKGGVLYPRCSTLGGCTAHHAMIIVRPNDSDWERIAVLTGDESWRSANMQGYFARIERCLYYQVYGRFLGRILGGVLRAVKLIAQLENPRSQLDPGGHGAKGWQPTSFIDPFVVNAIAHGDGTFKRVLFDVIRAALGDRSERSLLKRALRRFQLVQSIDPNVRSPFFLERPGLSLIPIGTDGMRREGLREYLLQVEKDHPERLVIARDSFALRLVFERPGPSGAPRAVGVEVARGPRLYKASVNGGGGDAAPRSRYFTRGEVIVCGGSFNTPQLLMLSGIGEREHLEAMGIGGPRDADGHAVVADPIDLPGVGRNLCDRYEISVISRTREPFSTLNGITFEPGSANDPARRAWTDGKPGLYTTNGGALAMMLRSSRAQERALPPNLFVFGVPAAFRGYYWGWPRDLLREPRGAATTRHDLWSWVILEAYTRNNGGTVRLLSKDPFATPQIIFHSFDECQDWRQDLDALHDAVVRVREINESVRSFADEVQPGRNIASEADLKAWISGEAWGHHACGTCRMGADAWTANPLELNDRGAVIDSRFRVHGVEGLRIVDASVFPEIPGYFIVTPTFMVSEKAADTLLADAPEYPSGLERLEAKAIRERRAACGTPAGAQAPAALPPDTVGLALSGGGIRSATFCLGVIQALASRKTLKQVDVMSTVSGGGYTGAFLGRLYTRQQPGAPRACDRVEEALDSTSSPELYWLRQYGNYLGGAGRTDLLSNIGHVARNLFSVHFCMGALFLAIFGLLRFAADRLLDPSPFAVAGIALSPWWWLPGAALFFIAMPYLLAFWLSPPTQPNRSYYIVPVLLWLALTAGAIAGLGIAPVARWSAILLAALVVAWFLQEMARWGAQPGAASQVGPSGPAVTVRNRLNRGFGISLLLVAVLVIAVAIDTLARYVSERHPYTAAASMAGTAVAIVLLRILALGALSLAMRVPHGNAVRAGSMLLPVLSFGLAAMLLFFVDVVAHAAFRHSLQTGIWLTSACILISLILGCAFRFLNLSSLHGFYGEKLVRTFLGATNDARVRPSGTDSPVRIDKPDGGDDVWFRDYHPEAAGGPLHLVNVCVNSTVDAVSGRQLPQDRGLPMCVGPAGVSVGRRFHALWNRTPPPGEKLCVQALPVSSDPDAFHVLARKTEKPVCVEPMRLGQWMSVSGAAFSTGSGRTTRLRRALLYGLLNLRLGYWWDTHVGASERPSRYPPGAWRRLKSLPAWFFRVQSSLLDEWRGYFAGPGERFWYLSDGGHFDNTGLYEMLRRRVPFVVAVSGEQDRTYQFEDLAILARAARIDFGADFRWIDPRPARQNGAAQWAAIDSLDGVVPPFVKALITPDALGALEELRQDSPACAALAHVKYAQAGARSETWLLLIKPTLMPSLPVDVRNYAATHPDFPNESTVDQFFGDSQWESYRMLGWCLGRTVLKTVLK